MTCLVSKLCKPPVSQIATTFEKGDNNIDFVRYYQIESKLSTRETGQNVTIDVWFANGLVTPTTTPNILNFFDYIPCNNGSDDIRYREDCNNNGSGI
jgi:hypothetical protein